MLSIIKPQVLEQPHCDKVNINVTRYPPQLITGSKVAAKGCYVQELSACQALTELDAAHNQLSALPSQLCALHSLKTLMVDSNR